MGALWCTRGEVRRWLARETRSTAAAVAAAAVPPVGGNMFSAQQHVCTLVSSTPNLPTRLYILRRLGVLVICSVTRGEEDPAALPFNAT